MVSTQDGLWPVRPSGRDCPAGQRKEGNRWQDGRWRLLGRLQQVLLFWQGRFLIWNKKYDFLWFPFRADLAEAAFLQVKKNSLRHYMQKIKFLSILVRHGRNRPGTFALPRLCLRNLGLLKHDEYHISLFVRKIFPLNFKSSMLFEKKSVYKITSHDLK